MPPSSKTPAKQPKARGRGRPRKYDWPTVERAYVEGLASDEDESRVTWPSLRQVAEAHGVPEARVYEYSAAHHWKAKREAHMAKIEAARRAARAKELAKEAVQFDERALNTAKMGMAMVTQRLVEMAKDAQKLGPLREAEQERLIQGKDVNGSLLKPVVKAYELDQLSRAALTWQQVAAKAVGDDAIKVEHSGPGGGPIETLQITQELLRDDPERLAGFLEVLQRTGVLDIEEEADVPELEAGSDDVVEAEVVEDEQEGR